MATTELTEDAIAVLRVFAWLHEQHKVVTVQAAAIWGRMSYMDAYDLVNQLFGQGLLTADLHVTEAGQKALKK